ncbi:hypothetical protein TSTA_094420 [Talaromyces stipitatus ATCC 10500]|uniref:Glutamyl-tRNA amidotransferase complex subunit Gta3 domain-containing protein n=1 Tax=Talaromyces stipitatus (strain ATCC 10500 / CBS 375.48 / QM 6759 / NRRL 1006) TaxID=441959 RepID=B8M2U1_TALSN|nr:uncharacterized protein TSTA_094420 [Talaromyces stipitatus ATCC 10500]EED22196.1 hypothetical protein TSTA_094420 [Talaromyces stipitatus ATCC 10500]
MPRLQVRLGYLRSARRPFTPGRQYSSQPPPKHTSEDIAALLSKPTWSIRSLLPNTHDPTIPLSITPQKLHHLLRLSALPQPVDKVEETSMLRTLEAQIHFVKSIQDVDIKDDSPLRAIRDESREAIKESTISLETLKEALAKEEVVGRRKKIERRTTTLEDGDASHIESDQWDENTLGSASRTAGRFFVVQKSSWLVRFPVRLPARESDGTYLGCLGAHAEKILESFEALHVSKELSPKPEIQDTPNSNKSGDVSLSNKTEEIIQNAVGLDPKSRSEVLAYFDEWQNSVLLRVGQVVDGREESEDGQVQVDKFPKEPAEPERKTLNRLQQVYPPLDTPLRDTLKAQRLLILRSLLLLLLGLEHYNAYSRVLLLHITSSLNLQLSDINDNEAKIARGLLDAAVAMTADEKTKRKAAENQNLRKWKVGIATVAGAALIGITGGLAAPLVAAGLVTVMGGLGLGGTIAASYLGALTSSGVVVGGLFGAYGGKMTGKVIDRYAREVEDFVFIPIRGKSAKKLKDEKEAAKEDHCLRVNIASTKYQSLCPFVNQGSQTRPSIRRA